MNKEVIDGDKVMLWNSLTFVTKHYRKNYNFIEDFNDNFITECEGKITQVRFENNQPPRTAGEYSCSVFNLSLANKLGFDLIESIGMQNDLDSYSELYQLIKNGSLSLKGVNKLVVIHTLVVHPDLRKKEITEEFIEAIYRDHYDDNVKILALVKPVQDNNIDYEYFFMEKNVKIRTTSKIGSPYKIVPAYDYYGLDLLLDKNDNEINYYKLYALASKCGFKRIEESNIFEFQPDKILKRLKEKFQI